MDRLEADRRALEHAIALVRGEAPTRGLWVTGPRAWKGWETRLAQTDRAETPAHGHANMRIQLLANRRAAIEYLMPMATRHGGRTGGPLSRAVAAYAQQLEVLDGMDTSREALVDPGNGRDALIADIRGAAALDLEAVAALEQTVAAMGR